MRLDDIVSLLRENFIFAFSITIILGVVLFVCYRFIYLKWLGGKKSWTTKQIVVFLLFVIYMMTVCALTLLNRGSNYQDSVNLALFSSYREAWYNLSVRAWQYIYFNILMFVPFGFFLPLLHKRFSRLEWTLLFATLFTGIIETLQYITGFGIFELDDLFNNVFGAIIGFGVVKAWIVRKRWWWRVSYLSPLLLVIILSGALFTYYDMKEFGNLSIVPATKVNMKNVIVTSNIAFNDEKPVATVYQAPRLSKDEAEQFAYDFFKNLELDTTNIEIIAYQNEANYRYHGEPSYFIWLHYLDRTFDFTDFSSFDIELEEADEATLKEKLKQFGITIHEQAQFERLTLGRYKWKVDKVQNGNQLVDGTLTADYYEDGTIKSFNQQIVIYEKVKDVELKSVQQAYDEFLDGKFKIYNRNIQHIEIEQVEMDYELDSKGFYQPVYVFSSVIDGESAKLLIPAVK